MDQAIRVAVPLLGRVAAPLVGKLIGGSILGQRDTNPENVHSKVDSSTADAVTEQKDNLRKIALVRRKLQDDQNRRFFGRHVG